MKILTIPDLHGKDIWMDILFGSTYDFFQWKNNEVPNNIQDLFEYPYQKYDKIIFLGDYVDAYDKTNLEILTNLENILFLKEVLGNKVELLIGNHDVQYFVPNQICSGYRPTMWPDLNKIFKENLNKFKLCYKYNNHIWTHAGITNNFYKKYLDKINSKNYRFVDITKDLTDIDDQLNFLFDTNDEYIYLVGYTSGGNSTVPGPLWARPVEISNDPLIGYIQIVGHTCHKEIIFNEGKNWKYIYTDVFGKGCENVLTLDL